jgi:hypothetical protein
MCLRLRIVTGIRLKLGEGMRHLGGRVYVGLEYVAGPGHYIDRHQDLSAGAARCSSSGLQTA